jgi:hypothetical protein
MSCPDLRPARTALIPWVLALVALFGLNVFVQDHSHVGKGDAGEGMGLSQSADDAPILGRVSNPQACLAAPPAANAGFLDLPSSLLCIETRRVEPVLQSARGVLRGRAPPAARIA